MIYKEYKGKQLSMLGLGTMRLPTVGNDNGNIDKKATAEMVDFAIKHGINYFDTGWGYHNGRSEPVIGEILSAYPRNSYYIATKFPGYDLSNMNKVEEIFAKQQERLKTDFFDFYLVHNVCELNINQYLDPQYRIYEYLTKMKKEGKIGHLGFSIHGDMTVMKRFLEVYGNDMEFCQIQLNWLDYSFQSAKAKLELLKELEIPVWVMEPLRGGKLANLSPEHKAVLASSAPDLTVPEWGFRYLQGFDSVKVVLSGMSSMQQLTENISVFDSIKPLDNDKLAVLYGIAKSITEKTSLPCTACRYCTEHCPMGLDIPKLIELYNEQCFTGGGFRVPMTLSSMEKNKHPSACIGCRNCEAVCPQTIKISEAMSDFAERLKK